MDAGFVGESVLADNRLVSLHDHAGDVGDQAADGDEALGLHAAVGAIEVVARAQGHDNLFERAVAGPLAQPVDRALDLSGAGLDGREAVGHGHPQVVVAVDADDGAVDVRHTLAERLDHAVHVAGRGVADGVGNVDRRRPGGNRRFDHLAEEIGLGPGRVLGRKLDVRAIARRPPHPRHRVTHNLLLIHLQLVLAMDGAGRQKDVDPRTLGRTDGFPGAVDVFIATAGQPANRRPANRLGDLANGLEVARRGDGKAGLDHVHAQLDQRLGNLHLLRQIHARPRRLLAVAKRRVENDDSSRRVLFLSILFFFGHGQGSPQWVSHWMVEERNFTPPSGVPTLGRPGQHQPRPRGTKTPVAESIGNHHGHWKTKRGTRDSKNQLSTKKPQGFFGPWGSIVLPVREYARTLRPRAG